MPNADLMMALWVPDWPVVAAIAHEKLPEHEPVAVVDSKSVAAISQIARAAGVRRGMRLRTARSVCPEVVFVGVDPSRDARVFELVLRAIDDVVAGVEIVRPGLIVFAAAGALRHWGSPDELAEQLVTAVAHNTGWESSVGLGEGLLGSVSAARRSVLLHPGETTDFLAPLPINELLVSGIALEQDQRELHQFVDLLQRMGIRSLGQFAQLKTSDVNARFGVLGHWAHRLVTNDLIFRGSPGSSAQEVHAFLDIDPPAQRVDQAAFAARQVATELHEKLIRSGLTCSRLQIGVRTESGDELARTWRYEGELTEREITDRVRWQLEGWISGRSGHSPDSGLVHIVLNALDLSPAGNAQGHLWGTTSKKDHHASRSLTRVQHLLGPTGVVRPVVEGGRDPHSQVRMVAWGDDITPLKDPTKPWPGRMPTPAPSLVYPKPFAVQVVDEHGRGVEISQRGEPSAQPHWLVSGISQTSAANPTNPRGARRRITGWAGPWIIAERSWQGQHARARFQFLLEDQRAVLASCQGGRWQVEASYD